jgi:hypothetical protein
MKPRSQYLKQLHDTPRRLDTIDIDIFAPRRQDWIDGTATYLSQK